MTPLRASGIAISRSWLNSHAPSFRGGHQPVPVDNRTLERVRQRAYVGPRRRLQDVRGDALATGEAPVGAQHHRHLAQRVLALGHGRDRIRPELGLGISRCPDGAEDGVDGPVAGRLTNRIGAGRQPHGHLRARLRGTDVFVEGGPASPQIDAIVAVDIERFDAGADGEVVLEAEASLRPVASGSGTAMSRGFKLHARPVSSDTPGLAATMGKLLGDAKRLTP